MKRLEYIDSARGFAIVAVVLGHIFGGNTVITKWLLSFHVALFFILTGVLLSTKRVNTDLKTYCNKKIKSLIIPYFIFCFINLLVELLTTKDVSILKWGSVQIITMYGMAAMWYLSSLFIAEGIFISGHKFIKNKYGRIILYTVISIVPFIFSSSNIIITVLFRSFIGLGFITIGFYGHKLFTKDFSIKVIALIFIMSCILSSINGVVDLYWLQFSNVALYIINSISGSLFIIQLFKKIQLEKTKSVFSFIGINSLFIMCNHQSLISIIKVFNQNKFIILMIVIILQYPFIKFINNHASWMLGKFKKKENQMELTA